LQAWTRGRAVARVAYRLTLEPPLSRHYGLADQIRRAAAAIPANIAEGYALGIALGSGTELCTHLELVRDLELAPAKSVDEALVLSNQVVGLLIGLIYSLRRRLGTTRPPSRVPRPRQSLDGR